MQAISTLHLRARACFQNMVGSFPTRVTEYKMDIFHLEGPQGQLLGPEALRFQEESKEFTAFWLLSFS